MGLARHHDPIDLSHLDRGARRGDCAFGDQIAGEYWGGNTSDKVGGGTGVAALPLLFGIVVAGPPGDAQVAACYQPDLDLVVTAAARRSRRARPPVDRRF